jgi:hypothetical protein
MNIKVNAVLAIFIAVLFVGLLVGVHAGHVDPTALFAPVPMIPFLGGAVFSEANRVSDWLKWEEDSRHSRDDIILLSGQKLASGAVIGKTQVGATAAAVAFASSTGNGVMGAITVTGSAKVGLHKLVVIEPAANAGVFEVEDPDGKVIGRGNVAAVFTAQGLSFTLADGATDFISGDGFDITVTGGTEKWKEHDPAGSDGSERPAGILLFAVDASATGSNADTPCTAITRQAIIGDADITWKTGMTAPQKVVSLAALKALGIIARKQV